MKISFLFSIKYTGLDWLGARNVGVLQENTKLFSRLIINFESTLVRGNSFINLKQR